MIKELAKEATERGIKYGLRMGASAALHASNWYKKYQQTKADQILEQMAEDLKPGYARKSEESPAENAWNTVFEPAYNADDPVHRTFWKGGRETIGDFVKGAAAPYAISTAKRVSDDKTGVRETNYSRIAGALASAILTLYMAGDPAVDKVRDYMAKKESAALVEKWNGQWREAERGHTKTEIARQKLERAKPEDLTRLEKELQGYESRESHLNQDAINTGTEIKKKIREHDSRYGTMTPKWKNGDAMAAALLAKRHPVDKWKLLFPTLFAITNAASAFYEGRKKRTINDGINRQ